MAWDGVIGRCDLSQHRVAPRLPDSARLRGARPVLHEVFLTSTLWTAGVPHKHDAEILIEHVALLEFRWPKVHPR